MNIEKLRAETPAVRHLAHFNNAGASLMSDRVFGASLKYWTLEREIGGYEAAVACAEAIADFYTCAARLINAKSEEIAYCDSATRGWNTILYGSRFLNSDSIILTSQIEFGSTVVSLQHVAELTGAKIVILPTHQNGTIDLEAFKTALSKKVALVAVTHVPAHSCVANPIEHMGALLKEHDAFFLVDACQSVGRFSVDVEKIGCDALITTGRKWLRGPRGTGFVYVRDNAIDRLDPPTIDLSNADWLSAKDVRGSQISIHSSAKRFETWERNFGAVLGLRESILQLLDLGVENVATRVKKVTDQLRDGLHQIPSLRIPRDDPEGFGILSIMMDGISAQTIKDRLSDERINSSVIHEWDAPWDFEQMNCPPLVRLSPHYFNTEEEIALLLGVLERIQKEHS